MLDYKLVEALALVVREGGFEKAAKSLHLTQSAVSQRVRLLEEQTGQVLLVRSNPPLPTASGRALLKHYLQVARLEDELRQGLAPEQRRGFAEMPIAVNTDSLSTWFLEALDPFLKSEQVVLDLRIDDQEQTHRMLKDGEVMGCVSNLARPMQGCSLDFLGIMHYRLVAQPEFAGRWFPHGLTMDAVEQAPSLVFSRDDDLNNKLFRKMLGRTPETAPVSYVPASQQFQEIIMKGLAYGVLPYQLCDELLEQGGLVDLAPEGHIRVELYWHRWSFSSSLLDKLSRSLIRGARRLLDQRT